MDFIAYADYVTEAQTLLRRSWIFRTRARREIQPWPDGCRSSLSCPFTTLSRQAPKQSICDAYHVQRGLSFLVCRKFSGRGSCGMVILGCQEATQSSQMHLLSPNHQVYPPPSATGRGTGALRGARPAPLVSGMHSRATEVSRGKVRVPPLIPFPLL